MRPALLAPLLLAACAGADVPPAGGLPAKVVAATMEKLAPELHACLSPARTPPTTGRLQLTWVVEENGHAELVQIADSTLANASIEGCMAGVVRRATFAAPKDEPFADARWTVDVATLGPATAPQPAPGVLGPTEVNAVLAANQNVLASCLAMAQAGGREVTGELELYWRVDSDGRVAWAQVAAASVRDVEVERCLVSAMMTILFVPPEGGAADLSIPLKLL